MVITPSPITYLLTYYSWHDPRSQALGLASVFITPKSYLNVYKRELGHLCPSGILRSISLSPTTCLSTWRYHYLSIITSLLVQVGPITLKCLFNAIGTIINPHLELLSSSSHQDPVALHIRVKIDLAKGAPSSHHPTYIHQTAIHIPLTPLHSLITSHLLTPTHLAMLDLYHLNAYATTYHHALNTTTLPSHAIPERSHSHLSHIFYTIHMALLSISISIHPTSYTISPIPTHLILEPTHSSSWYRD